MSKLSGKRLKSSNGCAVKRRNASLPCNARESDWKGNSVNARSESYVSNGSGRRQKLRRTRLEEVA